MVEDLLALAMEVVAKAAGTAKAAAVVDVSETRVATAVAAAVP